MKKTRILFSSIFVLLFISFCSVAFAEDKNISSDSEMQIFLANCVARKETNVDFSCTPDYYHILSDENFSYLELLLWESEISDASIKYISSDYRIYLENIQYGKTPYAKIFSLQELYRAVSAFSKDKVDHFSLYCTSKTLRDKLCDNDKFFAACGMAGIDSFVAYVDQNSLILKADNIEYFDIPWKLIETDQEFLDAIRSFYAAGVTDFALEFTADSFNTIVEDKSQFLLLISLSVLDHWSTSTNSYYQRVLFKNSTYKVIPKFCCSRESEISDAIKIMGEAGETDFSLILTQSLYKDVSENDFHRLRQLQALGGLVDYDLKYYSDQFLLTYSNAEIIADASKITSVEMANDYVHQASENGSENIYLFCTDRVYNQLMRGYVDNPIAHENIMTPFYDLLSNNGILHYTWIKIDDIKLITIHIKSFFPGINIMRAVKSGDNSSLTSEEIKVMEKAQNIAASCRTPDSFETALKIHNYLCANITYELGQPNELEVGTVNDNAIGALLNGRAECDGYSDSFFLIGSLAGLNVRYQRGIETGTDLTQPDASGHMWNLLFLNGSWRLVDVTWDDDDENGIVSLADFNIGYDRASRMHFWNEDMSVTLLPETDLSARPAYEYTVHTMSDVEVALADAAHNRYDNIYLYLESSSLLDSKEKIVEMFSQYALFTPYFSDSYQYLLFNIDFYYPSLI